MFHTGFHTVHNLVHNLFSLGSTRGATQPPISSGVPTAGTPLESRCAQRWDSLDCDALLQQEHIKRDCLKTKEDCDAVVDWAPKTFACTRNAVVF